jgi:hypothetical protein
MALQNVCIIDLPVVEVADEMDEAFARRIELERYTSPLEGAP